jgi:glycosyltransferase involved in cell wall biosynthesis
MNQLEQTSAVDILHVPYTYWPDAIGGTEIYVSGLAKALAGRGLTSAVAAPGNDEEATVDDFHVFRWKPGKMDFEAAYGRPDPVSQQAFRRILALANPKIVHFHAKTAAISPLLITAARAAGASVVFTYHTPTVTCANGTMVHYGQEPCDGIMQVPRCTDCVLHKLGIRPFVRSVMSSLPQSVGANIPNTRFGSRVINALKLTSLVAQSHRSARGMLAADRVVAVCDWVRDVIVRNGVDPASVVVCRQGVTQPVLPQLEGNTARCDEALRIAYFGRLDWTKGIDLLPAALRLLPHAAIEAHVYGVRPSGDDPYVTSLEKSAQQDTRFRLVAPVSAGEVISRMRDYDAIVVPSRWLETGPLVVLEAFAAKVPVLGARLGGIGELVRDGVDGFLFEPEDAGSFAELLRGILNEPQRIRALAGSVRPPRTMNDCARDMAAVYETLMCKNVVKAA